MRKDCVRNKVSVLLVVLLLVLMGGCSPAQVTSSSDSSPVTSIPESTAEPPAKQIAIISTTERFSSPFGQGVAAEAERFAADNDFGIEQYVIDDAQTTKAALDSAIENGAEVVVGLDHDVSAALALAAEDHAAVKFILLDREASFAMPDSPHDNMMTIGFCPAGAGWQAGYAAGCTALGLVAEDGNNPNATQPQVAILLPVRSITAVEPPAPDAEPEAPTDCLDDSMGAILSMVIPSQSEWGDRIFLTQRDLLYSLSALYGIDAAASTLGGLGVEDGGYPVLFIPVLGTDAELETGGTLDAQTAEQNALETARALFDDGVAMVIGVGEWQAPVQQAATEAAGWCVEIGENPSFGAGGFSGSAVAGVVQNGGTPVYTALEEWQAEVFVNGPRQVGAPQGGWTLLINEKVLASAISPSPLIDETALTLMQDATQAYINSGDEESLIDLKSRAMHGNVVDPDRYEFECVVVQAA